MVGNTRHEARKPQTPREPDAPSQIRRRPRRPALARVRARYSVCARWRPQHAQYSLFASHARQNLRHPCSASTAPAVNDNHRVLMTTAPACQPQLAGSSRLGELRSAPVHDGSCNVVVRWDRRRHPQIPFAPRSGRTTAPALSRCSLACSRPDSPFAPWPLFSAAVSESSLRSQTRSEVGLTAACDATCRSTRNCQRTRVILAGQRSLSDAAVGTVGANPPLLAGPFPTFRRRGRFHGTSPRSDEGAFAFIFGRRSLSELSLRSMNAGKMCQIGRGRSMPLSGGRPGSLSGSISLILAGLSQTYRV